MFRKLLDQGQAGDNVGVLLRGIKREDVERGQVLCKPGSVTPHTKFKAEAYILTKEEGGRHTPFFTNYRPQFYFRTTDVTGIVKLPEGTEMVMPGDNVTMDVELIVPIAMEEKLRFAIREGGRTVGSGVVAVDHRVRLTTSEPMAGRCRDAPPVAGREIDKMNTQNIRIRLKAFDHRVLDLRRGRSWTRPSAPAPGCGGPFRCPPGIEQVHREPFAPRRQEVAEQFEIRTHKRVLDIVEPTPQTRRRADEARPRRRRGRRNQVVRDLPSASSVYFVRALEG